ncbi:MAG: alpha-glucan family phosphorylase [Candidatus Kariarchaeaceae archaeon]|jgi:starch phosphorylase
MHDIDVPERIARLVELTDNLWWSWAPQGRDLFRKLDYNKWLHTRHNAFKMLRSVSYEKLVQKSKDPNFLKVYDIAVEAFDNYQRHDNKWFSRHVDPNTDLSVAYFSMEFGLHESLPIYSGGLGVLAGDTIKEASDLGIPLTAIGFLYGRGYFTQDIPPHGWQDAHYNEIDKENVPLIPVTSDDGKRLYIDVELGHDTIYVQIWKLQVGNVDLYLLDSDIPENKPWFKGLSAQLYGGDQDMRISQELVLASAGKRLLDVLGIKPTVWHLNEGHCAFLSIKRIHDLIGEGVSFDEAYLYVKNSTIFTTHTPVPAGHDAFPFDLVESKLPRFHHKLGITREQFFELGLNKHSDDNRFNMTVLGINTAHLVNGVSQLHYEVTKEMWKGIFEDRKQDTTLLGITNGVHVPTFISGYMRRLFEKYISPDWMSHLDDPQVWNKIDDIPDEEFWVAHLKGKSRLLEFIRESARIHRQHVSKDAEQLLASGVFLDPKALTIGFARRFATYKRADLIFADIERVRKMINDPDRPLQIIFAGKAHPADEPGKHMLQAVYKEALSADNSGRIAFIENYALHSAKYLVQGVDIWLNNPIRPHEASGTSGMKAAQNGKPHLSTLDGWWVESADHGKNGWVIGGDKEQENQETQNNHDVGSLYNLLENEIIPAYYNHNDDQYSVQWIKIAKEAVKTSIVKFSMTRMLTDYVNKMYLPTRSKTREIQQQG